MSEMPSAEQVEKLAMALVKKFRLDIRSEGEFGEEYWSAFDATGNGFGSKDLNRSICTCVATMRGRA